MKKVMLFILVFVGLIVTSCTKESQPIEPTKPVPGNGVLFKFTLPGNEMETRSVIAEAGENKVGDLSVLFFEPTTNGTGKFVGVYRAPLISLPGQDENQFSLEVESMAVPGLVKANPYSILAFANMKLNMFATDADFDSFFTSIKEMSENEVMNYAIMRIQGVPDDNTDMTGGIEKENLPMSAQIQKKANEDVVDVQLIRTVARFDVSNATLTHTIKSVSVWNAFTQATVWEKGYMDYNQTRTRRFYGRNFPAGTEMRGGIYAFQNVSTTPEQNDAKTTCLIIGIEKNGTGVTTYYRVNINSSESGQYLKRNNVYQITVQSVLDLGEDSEVNAYIKGKILLDISINSWDRDEDGLIIRDGANLLAIPTSKARFTPEAEQRQYYVYTLGIGTLELVKLDMPSGMDAWLGGPTNNDLFISVDQYTLDQRKGSIELRFAGMKGVIEIIQSGKTEKSLRLSHTTVPLYPAGVITDMVGANPILITSSGPWTAEIYGTDFSFSLTNPAENKFMGLPGGFINNIYTTSVNGDQKAKTNFVLITLDEDPANYRNVLVLTQAGTGGFTLTPNNTSVQFDADQALSQGSGNANVFTLTTGSEDDTWTIETSGPNADKFEIAVDATDVGGKYKGSGKITITAKEINYFGKYEASVKITHNMANVKNITLLQDTYTLGARLLNSVAIPETGGNRDIQITTTAGQSLGWTATLAGKSALIAKGFIPYFIGTDGKPIMDGANYATTVSGTTSSATPANVKIGMIGIGQDIRAEGAPEATVTAALTADPNVKTTPIVIKQDAVKYYNIYGQSTYNAWGTWAMNGAYTNHFGLFRAEIQTPAKFGPSGAVYTRSTPDVETWGLTSFANNTGDSRKRLINVTYYTNSTGTLPWETLRADDHVVFVINDHNIHAHNVFNYSGFGSAGFVLHESDIPPLLDKKITTNTNSVNTEIYKFLIGGVINGVKVPKGYAPFGVVDVSALALRSFDGNNTTLSAWPATFIPLIEDPRVSGRCLMGIDPTLRIIYVGETEIFGTFTSTAGYNETDNAVRFLNNLQAWIIMTNNYGDSFNEKFKIK